MSIIMRRTRLLAFRVPIRLRANEDNIEPNKKTNSRSEVLNWKRWYETRTNIPGN